MIEIRRILCPIDFSDFSRRALDHAIAIARWYDASVTVMHASMPVPMGSYSSDPVVVPTLALSKAERVQLLDDLNRFIAAESVPGVVIEPALREQFPVQAIIEEAEAIDADLVVLGSHGRSGFERFLLGSVTEKVLHKLTRPVLTVPRHQPDAVPAGPVIFRRILCPVDFSDHSTRALEYALSLAQEADGRLTLLHVLDDLVTVGGLSEQPEALVALQRQREEEARALIERVIPANVAEYCEVQVELVHGRPWREILRLASGNADLIVMGVRGRGAADLLVFGSTTQHVVRKATCPVLTIHGH